MPSVAGLTLTDPENCTVYCRKKQEAKVIWRRLQWMRAVFLYFCNAVVDSGHGTDSVPWVPKSLHPEQELDSFRRFYTAEPRDRQIGWLTDTLRCGIIGRRKLHYVMLCSRYGLKRYHIKRSRHYSIVTIFVLCAVSLHIYLRACCKQVLLLTASVCLCVYVRTKSRKLLLRNWCNLAWPMVNARSGWKLMRFDTFDLESYFRIFNSSHTFWMAWPSNFSLEIHLQNI